jgi:L-cysteine desulfidase
MKMSVHERAFQPGEGLIVEDIEDTIRNFGRMGRIGMQSTDEEILRMMLESETADMKKGAGTT